MAKSFLKIEDVFVPANCLVPEELEVGAITFFAEWLVRFVGFWHVLSVIRLTRVVEAMTG